jgi:hypothetical protein
MFQTKTTKVFLREVLAFGILHSSQFHYVTSNSLLFDGFEAVGSTKYNSESHICLPEVYLLSYIPA